MLTASDLQEIRHVVEEVVRPLQDEVQALRNDVKEIYDMLAEMRRRTTPEKEFDDLSLEQKILALNSKLISAAKQAGISLPR